MNKRKDYMKLFLAYCKKHEIWFGVCTDGSIAQCTYLAGNYDETFEPGLNFKLGSRDCFEWIKGEIKRIKADNTMNEKELIQAWISNEKPFLYVGDNHEERMAMQSFAWKITYGEDFTDLEDDWGRHYNNEHKFHNHLTYRLRPGYPY